MNHLSNIFVEVITIKPLFALAKPSAIADCRGEFQGLFTINYVLLTSSCFSNQFSILVVNNILASKFNESIVKIILQGS